MWTTKNPLLAKVTPRPVRIAYLVDVNADHEVLDAIFSECHSRWGGRRTLIIITDGETISETYMKALNLWDADIVYSYKKLSDNLQATLFNCFAPSEIRIHDYKDNFYLKNKPDFDGNFSFLSSLLTCPQKLDQSKS